MADRIQYIDNVDGDHIYPVAHQRGVLDDDGNSLEPKIQHSQDLDLALTSEVTYTYEQLCAITKSNYFITSDTGKYNTVIANKHVRVAVEPGDAVYVTANASKAASITFLRSTASSEAGGTPAYADGWENVTGVPVGKTMRFVAPKDARLLYISEGTGDGANARIPASLKLRRVNSPVYDMPLMKVDVAGTGDTLSRSKQLYGFIPEHTYRAHILEWPISGISYNSASYNYFIVYSYDDSDTSTTIAKEGCDATELKSYYDFTIPSDSKYIRISGRASDGYNASVEIEEITEIKDLSDNTRAYSSAKLEPTVITNNKMFNAAGEIVSESSINLYKYNVTPGEKYLFTGRRGILGNAYIYMIAWYDENEAYISKEPYRSTASHGIQVANELVIAPTGASYAFVNVSKTYAQAYNLKHIFRDIKGQETSEKADHVFGYLGGPDFEQTFVKATIVPGYYIKGEDGSIITASSFKYAQIPVSGASSIRFLGLEIPSSSAVVSGYAFYDGQDNVLLSSQWDKWEGIYRNRDYFVKVPAGAVTLRTSVNIELSIGTFVEEVDFYIAKIVGTTLKQTIDGIAELAQRPMAEHTVVGKGNTYSSNRITTLIPGHTYRIYTKYWPTSELSPSSSLSKLYVESYNGTEWNKLLGIFVNDPLANYYNITVPADSVRVSIGGRLNNGSIGLLDIEDITSLNSPKLHLTTIRELRAAQAAVLGLMPVNIQQDAEGWELPSTVQQLNVIKTIKQMCNIKWTPKNNLPGNRYVDGVKRYDANARPAGVQQTGIPYSGNWHYYKYIGIEVSIHTFMTAVNNPYSLLYTEVILKSKSKSAWGRTYYDGNGTIYYGTVCCGFTSSVVGAKAKLGNEMLPKLGKSYRTVVPLDPQDVNALKLCDIGNSSTHSWIVAGLHRTNGVVDNVLLAEAGNGESRCHYREVAAANFNSYISRNNYILYRYTDLYKKVAYTPCPYVLLEEYGETAPAVSYNNDICCFAGDKATFMVGDRIAVNYNLGSTPSRLWTSIEVYKDDELLDTYTISQIDQSALHESQRNHALDLGTALAAGKYMARLSDGVHFSDYTYWEVLPNNVSVTYNANGSYRITTSDAPISFIYLGQTKPEGWFSTRAEYEPTFYERQNNIITLYFDAIIRDWGMASSHQIRVMLQGDYGMAATPPISLPRRGGEGIDDGQDDPEED